MILQEAMLKGKNLYILILIGLAILISIFLMQFKSDKKTVLTASLNQVLMTEKGFEPETINVKVGTKIAFVNKDSVYRWPASDLHPTHTIYPQFDPKNPIKPGESWEFTFDKAGKWNYHDHLSPLVTGTIIVTQ